MNNFVRRILLALTLAVPAPVTLLAQSSVDFNFPFDFTAGNKSFAAGRYQITQEPWGVDLKSADHRSILMLLTMRTPASSDPRKSIATFRKFGDLYVLSKITSADYGGEIVPSRHVKELISRQSSRGTTIQIASTQQ